MAWRPKEGWTAFATCHPMGVTAVEQWRAFQKRHEEMGQEEYDNVVRGKEGVRVESGTGEEGDWNRGRDGRRDGEMKLDGIGKSDGQKKLFGKGKSVGQGKLVGQGKKNFGEGGILDWEGKLGGREDMQGRLDGEALRPNAKTVVAAMKPKYKVTEMLKPNAKTVKIFKPSAEMVGLEVMDLSMDGEEEDVKVKKNVESNVGNNNGVKSLSDVIVPAQEDDENEIFEEEKPKITPVNICKQNMRVAEEADPFKHAEWVGRKRAKAHLLTEKPLVTTARIKRKAKKEKLSSPGMNAMDKYVVHDLTGGDAAESASAKSKREKHEKQSKDDIDEEEIDKASSDLHSIRESKSEREHQPYQRLLPLPYTPNPMAIPTTSTGKSSSSTTTATEVIELDNEDDVTKKKKSNDEDDMTILFIFPEDASDSVTIMVRDRHRCFQDTFLNDSLIDFYMKSALQDLQSRKEVDVHRLVHIFSSFLYTKMNAELDAPVGDLEKTRLKAFNQVRRWTAGINIFDPNLSVLLFPINHGLHWSLFVCVFGRPNPVNGHRDGRILALDSFNNTSSHVIGPIANVIRVFLNYEYESRVVLNLHVEPRKINRTLYHDQGLAAGLDDNDDDNDTVEIVDGPSVDANDDMSSSKLAALKPFELSKDNFQFSVDSLLAKRIVVPNQNDGVNCGIHVLNNAKLLLEDLSKTYPNGINDLDEYETHLTKLFGSPEALKFDANEMRKDLIKKIDEIASVFKLSTEKRTAALRARLESKPKGGGNDSLDVANLPAVVEKIKSISYRRLVLDETVVQDDVMVPLSSSTFNASESGGEDDNKRCLPTLGSSNARKEPKVEDENRFAEDENTEDEDEHM